MKRSWTDLTVTAGGLCIAAGVTLTFAGWVSGHPDWVAAGGKLTALACLAVFTLLAIFGPRR